MTCQPLVSIIMGIYNCEKSLAKAIDSVVAQTYKEWELIMCNDGSTDDTLRIAKEYEKKHPNIHVIENNGNFKLAYSLNHCLKFAQGTYVARMDSDDLCLPDRLEKQVLFLEEHKEYAVVGGGIIPYDENGKKKPRIPMATPQKQDLLQGALFLHPTIMMRKEAYDRLNGYTVSWRTQKGQDLDMWYRFIAAGYQGYNLQYPVLMYHESVQDYKSKRSIMAAAGMMCTMIHGFRINHMPFFYYPLVLKPVIAALIPKQIMHRIHNKR